MVFKDFKDAIQRQFNEMKKSDVFRMAVDKDIIWDTYLKSFPEGSNPMYLKRTEHDCSCCKAFIRNAGAMVTIIDNKLVSIWDINIGGDYQVVADAMSKLIKECLIENIFLHYENSIGVDKNYQQMGNGTVLTWEHFFVQLPNKLTYNSKDIGTRLSEIRSTHNVMMRALCEINLDAIDTVLELIAQNSLYRGEEHKASVEGFKKLKLEFDAASYKEEFLWSRVLHTPGNISRIRNTVIGTLLTDLATGVELEQAVASFESKVAPTNYKRPSSLVTKAMVTKAQEKIEELGLTKSLERRFAVIEDINIKDVLFADRDAKKVMSGNVFDEIVETIPDKAMTKVEEITIENFISNVLPHINTMEVMVENKHINNLVSLIAPQDLTAKPLFKWNNLFSWSYKGEVADSIKERVKSAGGNVTGDVRCSLSWYNFDDLDLHMVEPCGNEIYYGWKHSPKTDGKLDVDMNAGGGSTRTPVENICYPNKSKMLKGEHRLFVNQFNQRENVDFGFEVEIEINGVVSSFSYDQKVKGSIEVAKIEHTINDELKLIPILPESKISKNVWNIQTNKFKKVSTMFLSPNYWNETSVGNKHYLFMLEGCLNDETVRGFYNEFLTTELDQHRKVLEIVGSKMKPDTTNTQLSGIGFSSTQKNSLMCKVTGNFTRNLKIVF